MFIPSCLQTLPLTWRTHLVGALVLSVGLQFSAHAHDQAGVAGGIQVAAANARDMTDGEVRRISKDTGKITLKHGEIKHLDMPGMTMVFQVKDPRLLDTVKVGDKVRFRAEQSGSVYWVTDLEVVSAQ